MFVDIEARTRLGNAGESRVARVFRRAGFEVVRSPKSRGTFDVRATRGDRTVVVQVKHYTGKQNASSRPFRLFSALLTAEAPAGARRVWWAHCTNTAQDFIWEITPSGFVPVTVADLI